MANIPVIPGVSVATKGILNKSLKDIICALLFGGLNNMLKGPLICVNLDIDTLLQENVDGIPSLADLKAELASLKDELKAAEEALGIKDMLGRVNGAIAEVQSLLALDGMCAIPMKAPAIPDILGQVIDAEFAEMNAILNDLGRLSKPSICLDGTGGLSFGGGYNPESILGSIAAHGGKMADIPGAKLNALVARLKSVKTALNKSINRQLFPDFRHKHNLLTGKPYAGEANVVTLAPAPTVQWNPPYPPVDTPNLKEAAATAQTLVASVGKSASYPADVNGIRSVNIWPGLLGPELYAMTVDALTPQDPLFVQQDPVYDYCGKLVGYDSTVVTGDQAALGGDPALGADLSPPTTNFNIVWINDRNCWAVIGNASEQIMDTGSQIGRKDTFLNKNPTIEMHRGYTHIFSIPGSDVDGFKYEKDINGTFILDANGNRILILNSVAPEFYIYKVNADLTPNTSAPFNLGLSRLETYELLEDANGLPGEEGFVRRTSFSTGTTLYFEAEAKVYSGTSAPAYPSELVWWYNTETCVAQKWVPDLDRISGTWTEVSNLDRAEKWVGSSNIVTDPHVNYLAYSNQDGSVYGLLKFV